MKRSLPIVPFLFVALYLGCDFQNPIESIANYQTPKWNVNLTIPLLDGEYGIAGIVNGSTIHSSGDSLLIKFDGILPRESVTEDFLKVPINIDETVGESFTVPPFSGEFSPIEFTYEIPIGLTVLHDKYLSISGI